MFVRLAMEYDIDVVVDMARQNIEETRPEIGFDEFIARETFYQYLDTADPTIFVVEDRREVVGFMLAKICRYRASAGHFTIQEVLFVRSDKRGSRAAALLMKHFVDWSISIGAKEIVGGNDNSFNSDRTARFLEHFGLQRVGHSMRRVL